MADKFEKYVSLIPEEERGCLIDAYYKRLTSPDDEVRFEAARRFVEWELNISKVCKHCYLSTRWEIVFKSVLLYVCMMIGSSGSWPCGHRSGRSQKVHTFRIV